MTYLIKKTIKGKEYHYLVNEVRIKNKKKKFQVYLGKNKLITEEKQLLMNNKIEQYLNKDNTYFLKDITLNIKDLLKENLISAILFGSYAKGTETEDSDVDILIIGKELPNINKRHEIIKEYQHSFLLEKKKKLSFILITKEELENWISNENPLLYGLITGYEYLYDADDFFRNKIVIFKNRMKLSNIVYVEDNYKIPLADII